MKMLLSSSSQICDSRFNCSTAHGAFFFSLFPTDPELFKSPATVLDFAFAPSSGISYSVTHSKMNWEEAHQNCNNNASELASILDPHSQALLFLFAKEYGGPLWIGLNSNRVRTKALHTHSEADTQPEFTSCSHLVAHWDFCQCSAENSMLHQCNSHLHWKSSNKTDAVRDFL